MALVGDWEWLTPNAARRLVTWLATLPVCAPHAAEITNLIHEATALPLDQWTSDASQIEPVDLARAIWTWHVEDAEDQGQPKVSMERLPDLLLLKREQEIELLHARREYCSAQPRDPHIDGWGATAPWEVGGEWPYAENPILELDDDDMDVEALEEICIGCDQVDEASLWEDDDEEFEDQPWALDVTEGDRIRQAVLFLAPFDDMATELWRLVESRASVVYLSDDELPHDDVLTLGAIAAVRCEGVPRLPLYDDYYAVSRYRLVGNPDMCSITLAHLLKHDLRNRCGSGTPVELWLRFGDYDASGTLSHLPTALEIDGWPSLDSLVTTFLAVWHKVPTAGDEKSLRRRVILWRRMIAYLAFYADCEIDVEVQVSRLADALCDDPMGARLLSRLRDVIAGRRPTEPPPHQIFWEEFQRHTSLG